MTAGPLPPHVSAETIDRTVLKWARPGDPVNLERALRLSDRLGGHLVAGHVDGLGRIKDLAKSRSIRGVHLWDPTRSA